MIRFYTTPVSNFGARVEILLRLKGLEFERASPPDGYGSAAYKAIVPTGTVPAIVDGTLVLPESETIGEYLEEAYPDPPLLPRPVVERAQSRLLARVHDTRIEPPLRALFPHMDPSKRDPEFVAARLAELTTRLQDLASMVEPRPYLVGPSISLADAGYAPTLLMGELMLGALGRALPLPAKLVPWRQELAAHPAVAPVLEAQGLSLIHI